MDGTERRCRRAAWLGLALAGIAPSAWAQTLACDAGALELVAMDLAAILALNDAVRATVKGGSPHP